MCVCTRSPSALLRVAGVMGSAEWDRMTVLMGCATTGNIVIIGVLVAAFVGYTVYQQRQGKSVSGKKMA